MTVGELATRLSFQTEGSAGALGREVECVYCCDLLSIVMGRAPSDSAWITVMGNVNAVAVAVLADTACIVLAEGMALDEEARQKAEAQEVAILRTKLPIFQAGLAIQSLLDQPPEG